MQGRRSAPLCVVIPDHQIETYLSNGWQLVAEPHCSGARMLPPNIVSVPHRVPDSIKKSTAGLGHGAAVEKIKDNGRNSAGRSGAQAF